MKSAPCIFMRQFLFGAALALSLSGCGTSTTAVTKNQTFTVSHLNANEINTYEAALANMRAGKTDKAIAALSQLQAAHPIHVGINVNLATAYYAAQDFPKALKFLDAAQKINPNSAEIANLYGLIHVAKGEYNAAEKNYLAALALNNNFALAHYNLALVYDNFYQDIDNAIAHYQQYLALVGNADKETGTWVEELKRKAKYKGGL